jgi:DNA-binding response OmpR family regulator
MTAQWPAVGAEIDPLSRARQLQKSWEGLLADGALAPGRLITRRLLTSAVWGAHYSPNPNLLPVHMANIRRKLETRPGPPRHFVTRNGLGYRFEGSRNEAATAAS